mmetsp:Transcript_114615/g.220833  ORF Transcript_114615/g.220833 Transcript_114615/m.220833 type:complete len:428 (-) Transcript_114615:11-1294(-)
MSSSAYRMIFIVACLICSIDGHRLKSSTGPLGEHQGNEASGIVPKARTDAMKKASKALAMALLSQAPAGGFQVGFSPSLNSMHPPAASVPGIRQEMSSTADAGFSAQLSRRALLLAALAAGSVAQPLRAETLPAVQGDDSTATQDEVQEQVQVTVEEELEETLIQRLQANTIGNILPSSDQEKSVEDLITDLERRGGSLTQLANEPGSLKTPWIGAWDILYAGGKSLINSPLTFKTSLKDAAGTTFKLVSARQFVNGVVNATAELMGIPGDDGISTEYIYAPEKKGPRRVLLARSGSLLKLANFAYKFDFRKPRTFEYKQPQYSKFEYQLPTATPDGDDLDNFVLNPTKLPAKSVSVPRAGAFSGKITYLSNRLWISRSSDDGVCTVLRRCNSMALVPSPVKKRIFAACAETGWMSGEGFCRKRAIF